MVDSLPQRHSIRVQNYDYSRAGSYFVTIVIQNRLPLLGTICEGEISLTPAGSMVEKTWREISIKFPNVENDIYCIMPNHFHGVIDMIENPPLPTFGGGDPCVASIKDAQHYLSLDSGGRELDSPLSTMIQWFKTMTTNEYIHGVNNFGWAPFQKRLWQRYYYDHIIRTEADRQRIYQYITDNPMNWSVDKENPLGSRK